ncbi:MAG TPA: hypothetical protein VF762_08105, partial [Blastocatellia bacterium]
DHPHGFDNIRSAQSRGRHKRSTRTAFAPARDDLWLASIDFSGSETAKSTYRVKGLAAIIIKGQVG